jgi:methylthioribulose-1-phosphate dehydratase
VLTFLTTPLMASLSELAPVLAATGRALHARGWAPATSGNFSAVLRREPLVLAISRSGVDKARLGSEDIIEVDADGRPLEAGQRPSDETSVHLAVVRERDAGAVLHTHSVWNTLLSEAAREAGGLRLSGYELLKALAGVSSHEHTEFVPVVENTQDYRQMAGDVADALRRNPQAHALLLRGHGLYAWGRDIGEAQRHVEALEFLFEVEGLRRAAAGWLAGSAGALVTGGRDGGD